MGRVKQAVAAEAPAVAVADTAGTVDVRQHTLEERIPLAERMNDENRIPVEEERARRQAELKASMGIGLVPTPVGFSEKNPWVSSVTFLT